MAEHDEEFDVIEEEASGVQVELDDDDELADYEPEAYEPEESNARQNLLHGDDDGDELAAPEESVSRVVLEKLKATEEQLNQTRQVLWQNEKKDFLGRYDTLKNKLDNIDSAYAEAIENQDGVLATKLMRYRDELRANQVQMEQQWNQAIEAEETAAQRLAQETKYTHQVKSLATRWQKEFGYHNYDKQAKTTIFRLDDQYAKTVAKYPPSDPRYWTGLTKYIESKTERESMKSQTTSTPTNRSNQKTKTVYISPERKEALIQAGVWDDPVLRMKYVKRYQEWDRENNGR